MKVERREEKEREGWRRREMRDGMMGGRGRWNVWGVVWVPAERMNGGSY